jgi:cytochrome b
MTPAQSTARLLLYVLAAALAVLANDFQSMETASMHQWIGLFLKAALAGVVTGRAYIDKSPTEVIK